MWLMGVREGTPESRRRVLNKPCLIEECRPILEDFDRNDVEGSSYAIHPLKEDWSEEIK